MSEKTKHEEISEEELREVETSEAGKHNRTRTSVSVVRNSVKRIESLERAPRSSLDEGRTVRRPRAPEEGTSVSAPDSLKGKKPKRKKRKEKKIVEAAVGPFDEVIFNPPGEVEVKVDTETKEVVGCKLTVKEGRKKKSVELSGWAFHKFIEKMHNRLSLKYVDITHAPPEEQAVLLAQGFNQKNLAVKVLMADGVAVSVVSPKHRQFNFDQVKEDLTNAVKEQLGEVEIVNQGNHRLFRLPVDLEYLSAWLRINPGNNLAKGPSAIKFNTSFRTEFDTASGGKAPACMNWANVWTVPTQLFNIPEKRLKNLPKIMGAENVDLLTGRNIHTLTKAEINLDQFKEFLAKLVEAVPKIKVAIDQAVSTPLDREEMKAILDAYRAKTGLAKYLIKMILENVHEETVWGLSQAVSWVRTHGEYKGVEERGREAVPNTRIMENIAGEVYSIAPMIADLRTQNGPITHEMLGIPKPQEKEEKGE